ncbi:MAG: cytochrome c maturation protein CcmE [Actinomycetota bacterium]
MDTPIAPTSQKRRLKFAIGGVTIALVMIGLMAWAMARPGSTAFYKTTSEVLALGPSAASTDALRVNGKVVPGSVEKEGLTTRFAITDGRSEMIVQTDQPLPDTFRPESDVIASGSFDGTSFVATHVSAKCPSKFKAKA